MAFNKKEWTNRIAEYINRRLLTKEDGSTELVTVAREEGSVSQEGDAFNADNMNDLEERIADEFENVNNSLKTHTHDDRYYTEAEVNDALIKKADKENTFGHKCVGENSTSGKWTTISGIDTNKPILIGVTQNANHYVQAKVVIPDILRNCNTMLPFQIFHGANVCTQYYLSGTTLGVFNYTGYQTYVWQ